ncbi:MAG: hypothetical protein GXX95_01095 [Methanomassiliicoccus sp.]|nr:hypothetical protein [Methanomassiliicoccus sp.]
MARRRESVTVTLPPEATDWLDKMVGERIFANRSHGIELALLELKKRMERGDRTP